MFYIAPAGSLDPHEVEQGEVNSCTQALAGSSRVARSNGWG